ncbi:MAG: sigma-70 family RNA polymerase sigma factor [Candidatus Peregrinibacteria bacterium]
MADAAALTEPEILALVRKAKDGDTDAFEQIYRHFFTPVYRFAAIRVPEAVAEDVVADVFVKVWEKLHKYTERKGIPFGAWVFRIARNVVVDSYRTSKSWEEMPEDVRDPDEWNKADTGIRRALLLKTVRSAFDHLPRRYRDVLTLSFMADLSHAEVAKTLRISEGTVRIRKFRALKKLEDLLPPESKEHL